MKNSFILVLLSFIAFSCSKSESTTATHPPDQLPAITTTGANTAGCFVNGELLIPKNGLQGIGGSPNYGLELTTQGTFYPNKNGFWQLEIANKKDFENFKLTIWIKNMSNGNGDYPVNQSNGQLFIYGPNNNQIFAYIKKNGLTKTYYSSNNSGNVIISRSDLAVGNAIFSGTFNCTLYNLNDASEKIEIKDGRFDINGLSLNK